MRGGLSHRDDNDDDDAGDDDDDNDADDDRDNDDDDDVTMTYEAWSPKGIRIDDRIGAPQIPFIAWLGFFCSLLSTNSYCALVNLLISIMTLFT